MCAAVGWLVVAAALDLAEADVIDEQELDARPALEAVGVGAIGEAGVEVVEQVDATGVADADALLACAQRERLEQVALAGAVVAGDDEIVVAVHEVEAGELECSGADLLAGLARMLRVQAGHVSDRLAPR